MFLINLWVYIEGLAFKKTLFQQKGRKEEDFLGSSLIYWNWSFQFFQFFVYEQNLVSSNTSYNNSEHYRVTLCVNCMFVANLDLGFYLDYNY